MPKLSEKSKYYLTIEINKKTYQIPLAKSLKLKTIRKIAQLEKVPENEQIEVIIDFFGDYIGQEVIDDMTVDDLMELFTLWNRANTEADGMKLGES